MADLTTDVAIIGAGPSGLFMVFEAGFMGYRSVVLDSLPQVGGQLAALYPEKPIYDVPGHPAILAGVLVSKLQEQAAPYQPTYLLGEAVTDVQTLPEQAGFLLQRAGGQRVAAQVVVIAGGGGACLRHASQPAWLTLRLLRPPAESAMPSQIRRSLLVKPLF